MTERSHESVSTPGGPVPRVRATVAAIDGLVEVALDDPIQQVVQAMWQPEYPRVEPV